MATAIPYRERAARRPRRRRPGQPSGQRGRCTALADRGRATKKGVDHPVVAVPVGPDRVAVLQLGQGLEMMQMVLLCRSVRPLNMLGTWAKSMPWRRMLRSFFASSHSNRIVVSFRSMTVCLHCRNCSGNVNAVCWHRYPSGRQPGRARATIQRSRAVGPLACSGYLMGFTPPRRPSPNPTR